MRDAISSRVVTALVLASVAVLAPGCGTEDPTADGAAASLWDTPASAESYVQYPTSLDVFADEDIVVGTIVDVVPDTSVPSDNAAEGATPEEWAKRHVNGIVRVDEVTRGSLAVGQEIEVSIRWPRGEGDVPLPLDEARQVATTSGPAIWVLFVLESAYLATPVFVVQDGHVTTPWDPAYASAVDADRFTSLDELADALRALPGPGAPANDLVASAAEITSLPFATRQDTRGATNTAGESTPAGPAGTVLGDTNCGSMLRTVWYRYTASADGPIKADTKGSQQSGHPVAGALAVWREEPAGRTLVACNFEAITGRGSVVGEPYELDQVYTPPGAPVLFQAEAGSTYYFQVGGAFGGYGDDMRFNVAAG